MYIVLVCFGIVTISVLCTVIEIKTEVELICLAVCLGLSLEDLVLEQPIFKSAHNKKTTEGFWVLAFYTPPPFFLSRGFCRFCSVLYAVCCAALCVPGGGAALRCCTLCRPVLCCCVLCCFAALGWCRCSSWRAPFCSLSPWGPVLCVALFCGVPPRCVCFVVAWWCVLLFAALLCAVCVLGCCAVRSLSSLLCAVLCSGVLVHLRCAVRVVRAVAGTRCCCALPCVLCCFL